MNKYRDYSNCNESVVNCYKEARKYQTTSFVKDCIKKYCVFKKNADFWDLFDKLSDFVDLSDPDLDLPNKHHLFQTAEGIRKDGHPEWMQVVGLIHDLGKIIYLKGNDEDGTSLASQWAIVGDTFITGCKIPDEMIFREFNMLNPEMNDDCTNTKLGIYKENCGLENVLMSFGHDEYLYQLLKHNNVKLPDEAYYMIRYHSCYLWHQNNKYDHLMNDKDKKMKAWVKLFNKYDLYTKENLDFDTNTLRLYYGKIVKKYLPERLNY